MSERRSLTPEEAKQLDDEQKTFIRKRTELFKQQDELRAMLAERDELREALDFVLKHFGNRTLPGDEIDAPPIKDRAIIQRVLNATLSGERG